MDRLQSSDGTWATDFAQLLDLVPDLICISSTDGYFKWVNPAFERVLGYTREEMLTTPYIDLVHPDDRNATSSEVVEQTTGRPTWSFLNRYLAKDGTYRWLDWDSMPVPERGLMYAVAHDVTEQRRMEEALRESEQQLNAIVNSTGTAIILIDAEGGLIESFNPAAERLFGYSRNEALGRQADMLWATPARAVPAIDPGLLDFGQLVLGRRKDGTTFDGSVLLSETTIGSRRKIIAALRDITSRRQAAEALREAKEAADTANRAKSEFLSRMSHELRTPLNVVLGFGQLLEMEALTRPQMESVAHILSASSDLLALIDEILNLSRIEAGQLTFSTEPVSVEALVVEVIALMSPIARAHDVQILNGVTSRCVVLADQQRLKQVLLNLVSNAIKYNRPGGQVHLDASSGEHYARITVADTGRGIAPANVAKLFTPFERLDAASTGIEGTGLGLSLSRGLTEGMKGTIGLESTLGEGSTFWVDLPSGVGHEAPTREHDGGGVPFQYPAHSGKTVVYVEDNLENVALVERIFGFRPGLELIPVGQGLLALDLIREHIPDLVLLDLHLPDISGFELFQRLQADPVTRAIPVVVASADATEVQIRRLREAGVREYLTKPFNVKHFLEVLDELLSPET
jgi:PAS domain S-box-containing protein